MCYLINLKFTLTHLKAPTCFDHTIILREHTLFAEDDRVIETCRSVLSVLI